jgi:hypothetical protein
MVAGSFALLQGRKQSHRVTSARLLLVEPIRSCMDYVLSIDRSVKFCKCI